MTDRDVLLLTLYGEARGEGLAGKAAVAAVIRNRLTSGKWGRSYEAVCLAPSQFSCWWPSGGKANASTLQALKGQAERGALPDDPVLKACGWIADGCLAGAMPDETGGATHYFVTRSKVPAWAQGELPTRVVGSHSFFRL